MCRILEEGLEMLIENIVDAIESTEDRDIQFDMVKTILIDNGIVEIVE